MASRTHRIAADQSVSVSATPQANSAEALAKNDELSKVVAPEAKENRSTSGQPVGKPIVDMDDVKHQRDVKAAAEIVKAIRETAAKETSAWKPHYLAILRSTPEVRAEIIIQLRDMRVKYNDDLAKAGENHLTRTLSATTYVRISELRTFAQEVQKGLDEAYIAKSLEIDGKAATVETVSTNVLYAIARAHKSGTTKPRVEVAAKLTPEAQFTHMIFTAISRGELDPSIMTKRWVNNHVPQLLNKMVDAGQFKRVDKAKARSIAADLLKMKVTKKDGAGKVSA